MIQKQDIDDMWELSMRSGQDLPPQIANQILPKEQVFYAPNKPTPQPTANEKQIGGDHYRKYGNFQPWDAVIAWNLGYLEGTALKYIARWKDKNGIEDIKKAIHFLQKLVETHDKR